MWLQATMAGPSDGMRLEVLEPPVEPQCDRRERYGLHDVVPGLQSVTPPARGRRAGREVTPPGRLPWQPVRVIALPVKSLADAKTRLDPVLTPLERGALTLAMLEDVLDATLDAGGLGDLGHLPRRGRAGDRDGSGAPTRSRRTGRRCTTRSTRSRKRRSRGRWSHLAVLLADTPLVTAAALTRALHTLGPVVLAPSLDESGTNLLVRRPPQAIDARFGTDSYRKHLERAAEADVPVSVVEIPEIAFDLDLPGDILTRAGRRQAGPHPGRVSRDGRGGAYPDPDLTRGAIAVAQGTIKDYDETTKTGSLLTEAREEIAIEAGLDRRRRDPDPADRSAREVRHGTGRAGEPSPATCASSPSSSAGGDATVRGGSRGPARGTPCPA